LTPHRSKGASMFVAFVMAFASTGFQVELDHALPDRIQDARAAEIKQLIAVATPLLARSEHDAKYPVLALGILRAEEAVPLLVKHLAFTPLAKNIMLKDKASNHLRDMLPCVYALSKIGHASFDAVIEKTCKTDDDYHVMCAAIVLRTAVGPDDAVSLLRAREARWKDPGDKKRILQVITAIDKDYRNFIFQ
jgi:hypothetical protein